APRLAARGPGGIHPHRSRSAGAGETVTAPPKTGPDRLKDLWLPIGPSTVTNGQAADAPNVTGRVLEVQVSPSGKRVYAATAGGGVWYSPDEGASWLPLGAWATTPQAELLDHFANTLTS